MIRAGDRLPDVALLDASGASTSLAAFGSEATLMIFLRHLA